MDFDVHEEIAIAVSKLKEYHLYPEGKILFDFYVLPSHNHQTYFSTLSELGDGCLLTFVKPLVYDVRFPGEPMRMLSFSDCKRAEALSENCGQFHMGQKRISEDFAASLSRIKKILPEKYEEGNLVIDGVLQTVRIWEKGAVVKEVVYTDARRIPCIKEDKESVARLDHLYLEMEELIS